ncbi:MAG: sulfate adenylyltransferase, partial [Porticoccaceae bacterium]
MIKPHGSESLDPRLVGADRAQQLLAEAETLPSLLLNSAAAANAVMLGAGYFNPLKGYMNLADALSVSTNLHTEDGLFWPVPVLNMVEDISAIEGASRIALRDPNTEGNPIMAVMDVAAIETVTDEQITQMAQEIFATTDSEHPGVATFTSLGRYIVSGDIEVLNLSYFQADFPDTFRTAVEI